MKRWLLFTLGVLSLLLCAATVALWVRSDRTNDSGYVSAANRWFFYTSLRGSVAVYWFHRSDVAKPVQLYFHAAEPADDRRADPYGLLPHTEDRVGGWGLWYLDPGDYVNLPSARQVIIPLRFPAALFFILAAAFFWTARRVWRRRCPGLCPTCGYDLRASKGRCPECGTPTTTSTSRPPRVAA